MIHLLSPPASGQDVSDYTPADPHNVGEAPRCTQCRLFVGMKPWLPPHHVELRFAGTGLGEIVRGSGDSLLVSERFSDLWHREGLVGLEGFDHVDVVGVEALGKTRALEVPRYRRVSAVRSNAAVDQQESGFEWERPPTCDVCRLGHNLKAWTKIVLETPAEENVFIARGFPGRVLVDSRFQRFCENHAIRGAYFVPGSDSRRRP
jgi:hypothetical protein